MELERVAEAWGLTRIWRTTRRTTEGLLGGEPLPRSVRPWTRHLKTVRERTVLEHLLREWLQAFLKLPPRLALVETREVVRRQLRPRPEQPRKNKLRSVVHALTHPHQPYSAHD